MLFNINDSKCSNVKLSTKTNELLDTFIQFIKEETTASKFSYLYTS